MKKTPKIISFRIIHALIGIYFIFCIIYLYYSAIIRRVDFFLVMAIASLFLEGFLTFIFNKGNCPFGWIQQRIGDDIPFFNLFLPPKIAKRAVPFFAILTIIGVVFFLIRLGL